MEHIYKELKTGGDLAQLKAELENKREDISHSKRLYLYFTQLGKCMYSGQSIDLDQLFSAQYDVDHIYPRSKIKDDSLDNLVLVKSELNKAKSDGALSQEIRDKMQAHWLYLKQHKLISQKKFEHLMTKEFTPALIGGFLNRQLVATQYSTISVIRILESLYGIKPVYVKAGLVSEFRKDVLNYVKSRSLNDLHHAKDAYLNIVVGNVYNSKFTNNPLLWIKNNNNAGPNFSSNYNRYIFNKEQELRGKRLWSPKEDKAKILKFLASKNIQCTLQAFTISGGLFNQTIYKPQDKPKFEIKKGLPVEKYGGYKSEKSSYFVLYEYTDKKGKLIKRIDTIPLTLDKFKNKPEVYEQEVLAYLKRSLGLGEDDQLKVLIPKILKNSILRIDGYNYYLTGNNETHLIIRSEPQLILDPKFERLFEQAVRFYEKRALNVSYKDSINKVEDFNEQMFKDDNWKLYTELKRKYEETFLKNRLNWSLDNYAQKDNFYKLNALNQCKVLIETAHAFNRVYKGVNLKDIGIKGDAIGITLVGKSTVFNKTFVSLIHKSITGLYEQEIKLK